jgi:XRE family transcriptional regulator, regulator of sulfur utilization
MVVLRERGVGARQHRFAGECPQQRVVAGADLVRAADDRVDHPQRRVLTQALIGASRAQPREPAPRARAHAGDAREGREAAALDDRESGEGNLSLTVLVTVAQALGVPIDELLASPRSLVRRWPAAEVSSRARGRGVTIRELVPEPVPDEMMEVMDFAPGAVMGGTPHLPGTREFFTCLDGRVNLMVAGDRYELAEGDVLAFPGNLAHSYQNADALATARGVSVVVLAKAGV